MKDTLFTNKKFITVATILMALLALFILALFINEIRSSNADAYGSQPVPSITVSGEGDVMATSDIATLSVNISKDASTTTQAQADLNDAVTKALAYVKTQNVDDKDVKSEYGGVSPKYAATSPVTCMIYPCPQPSQKIVGYTATQSITITVRAIDNANTIRTGLANLGITDISGPTFSIDNSETYTDQARAKAIDDARAKAIVLAGQLHVHLGKIVNFSENGSTPGPIMYSAKAMSSSAVAPDMAMPPTLPTGQNKITSNVTITYEID
jgi:uncharacterized protein